MNAKDFAHELEKAASFIRQQQAEIEALKAGKIRAYDNGVEDGRKPNTNLVKELTDEEINQCWAESHEDGIATQQGFTTQQHYFAHIILRKAQKNG